MTIDTDKIRPPKKKKSTFTGPDGLLYMMKEDGTVELIPGQDIDKADMKELQDPLGVGASVEGVARALRKTRKSLKDVDGPDLTKRAKGGMVKGYMGGGEVHMDDSPNSGMITQRGWGASRKT
jgi:hypothetical protein